MHHSMHAQWLWRGILCTCPPISFWSSPRACWAEAMRRMPFNRPPGRTQRLGFSVHKNMRRRNQTFSVITTKSLRLLGMFLLGWQEIVGGLALHQVTSVRNCFETQKETRGAASHFVWFWLFQNLLFQLRLVTYLNLGLATPTNCYWYPLVATGNKVCKQTSIGLKCGQLELADPSGNTAMCKVFMEIRLTIAPPVSISKQPQSIYCKYILYTL